MATTKPKLRPDTQQSIWDLEDGAEVMEAVGISRLQQKSTFPPPFSVEDVIERTYEHYRNQAFPYPKLPLHMCMQELNWLAQQDDTSLPGSPLGYRIADTYHPHRYHGHATGKISPFEAYHDPKRIRHAIELEMKNDLKIGAGLFSSLMIVLGTQACANFRPGYAAHLYRRYCPNKDATVLDTSTGYGGRLVGAIASRVVKHYIGIDPNVPTHEGNTRLAHDLAAPTGMRVDLINRPAEDVWEALVQDEDGLKSLIEGQCDFAFTSPPYFAKEQYSDDATQSWKRYGSDKSGESWRDGFLQPMMFLQFVALKPGAHAVVNIADVKLNNRVYPLKDWTIELGKRAGFVYLNTEVFRMNQRIGANQIEGVAEEPVLIFRKPE